MFETVLSKNAQTSLALLGKKKILDFTYLAGGSACALQLGHRVSLDFDFFTQTKFQPRFLAKKLQQIVNLKIEQIEWGTILGQVGKTKFSLFYYDYPPLFPFKKFKGINVADLRDIAAMKIAAIGDRGTKRDFIDLYFICQQVPLEKCVALYDKKFKTLASNLVHILKSLNYFIDAEEDKRKAKMLKKVDWIEVKTFFQKEVKRIEKELTKKYVNRNK